MRKYWITNLKSKKYIEIEPESETFDGEWKENHPHVAGADWLDVYAYTVWDHDRTSNGIYYVYDLCRDGGLFTLLIDTDRHSKDDIDRATKEIRFKHDVVSLHKLRLTKAEGGCRMRKMMRVRIWVPVRVGDNGREWFDVESWGLSREIAEAGAKETAKKIPTWAASNPIVRFARVELKEVQDETEMA